MRREASAGNPLKHTEAVLGFRDLPCSPHRFEMNRENFSDWWANIQFCVDVFESKA